MSCFYTPEHTLCRPSWKKVKSHHRDLNKEPSAYRAVALTAALWYSFHPQRCKYDISPTCLHLLATHTNSVGPRPHTIMGSATFLVKMPSWQTLDGRELTLGVLFVAQRLAHLPGKQVLGLNPGGAVWHFSNLACKVYFREFKIILLYTCVLLHAHSCKVGAHLQIKNGQHAYPPSPAFLPPPWYLPFWYIFPIHS